MDDQREKTIYRVTIIGSIGNFLLLIFKFVAGILGHSAAMIADAVHSLTDFITDAIVIIFVKISAKPSDKEHDYGHGKYETLATVIISIILFFVGAAILYKSIMEILKYLHGEELQQPGMIALIAAILSIVVKEGLYRYTKYNAKKIESTVMEANAWHHRSDALSSIGTAVGIAGAIFFGVKGRVLDPLAAALVSFLIMGVAYKLLKPCLGELLETSLPEEEENRIIDAIKSVKNVYDPHNLRTRRIGSYASVEVHVRMNSEMTVRESHEITREIEARIKDIVGEKSFVSIHVEPYIKQPEGNVR